MERVEGRLRWAAVGYVALWLWLAMSVLLLNSVYFVLVPVAVPVADGAVLGVLLLSVVVLLARFQPRIAKALGGQGRIAPSWTGALGLAALILIVGLLAQMLGLLGWVGMTALGSRVFGVPDPGLPRWVIAVILLDWQRVFWLIAFAYTALVVVDVLRRYCCPVRINRQ